MIAMNIKYEEYAYLKGVSGIYRFYNKISGKSYIGRSIDIYRRICEHFRHSKTTQHTKYHFYNALRLYDYNDWEISCIYETSDQSELICKEKEFIDKYDSFYNGYNSALEARGGSLINERSPNAKLTNNDVEEIRTDYKNGISRHDSYKKFSDKISYATFVNIWRGTTWKNIMPEVYTEAAKQCQKVMGEFNKKINSQYYKDLAGVVCEIRKLYCEEKLSASEVFDKFNFLNRNTFNDIWYGRTYPELMSDEYKMKLGNRKKIFGRRKNEN